MFKKFTLPMLAIFLSFGLSDCADRMDIAAIKITVQPQGTVNVVVGNINVTLTIKATATDGTALTYQWYRNTTNSTKGGTLITGATTANYTLPANLAEGIWYYFCELIASDGTKLLSAITKVEVSKFVAVTGINNLPSSAYANTPLTLTGTVAPTNASFKTITWSIVNIGTTGSTLSGSTLSPKSEGIVMLRATIANGKAIGTNYTQDFSIPVSAAFVPVTKITLPSTEAQVNMVFLLYGMIEPVSASNQNIKWSIVDKGTTKAELDEISSLPSIMASSTGFLTLRATVVNGKTPTTDYTEEFTIKVNGDGSSENPYLVSTAADLQRIGHDEWELNKRYIQTHDIDLQGITWTPIGTQSNRFTGIYNGDGYAIKNLTITGSGDNMGLFGYIGGSYSDLTGYVMNLALIGVNIDCDGDNVGAIAGSCTRVFLSNCYVTGSIINKGNNTGGIVGSFQNNTNPYLNLDDCYSTCSVTGNYRVGGIMGSKTYGTVRYCYATGAIKGNDQVGGLVGYSLEGTINNSVALNSRVEATGGTNVGRAVGNTYGPTLFNLYASSNLVVSPVNGIGAQGTTVTAATYGVESWWTTAGIWATPSGSPGSAGAWKFNNNKWKWSASLSLPVLYYQ